MLADVGRARGSLELLMGGFGATVGNFGYVKSMQGGPAPSPSVLPPDAKEWFEDRPAPIGALGTDN